MSRRLSIGVLALLPFAGCFESARVDELSCTKDKFCPDGYVCVTTQTGAPGKCQKGADAGRLDGIVAPDGANGSDGQANPDARPDNPVVSSDGTTGADALTDQTTIPDGPVESDAAAPSLDLSVDVPVSLPEAPDGAVIAPDLGPDMGRDVAVDLGRDLRLDFGLDVTPDLPYSPEVGPDVAPTSCVIGGTTYANGAANPANACQVCKLATSSSSWSNADEGTSCDSGKYCNGGSCKVGCFISGAYYANGAANPANACQTCQTAYALTSWTTSTNGANCGAGQVCNGGTCQSGCWIDGALIGSGTTNSSNVCQICKPATSLSAWSSNVDGTPCGNGKACSSGICQCTTGTDCGTSGCINVNGNDSNHCGSCIKACGAGQSCSLGTCACTQGASSCGGCLAWDFESSLSPAPWSLEMTPGSPGPNGATNIGVTQSKYHGGSHSLVIPVQIDYATTFAVEATVSLSCKVNLSGYTGWAYVYFDGSYPLSDFGNQLILDTWISSGTTTEDHNVPFFGNIPTATNWTGTMYVDDVVINGL